MPFCSKCGKEILEDTRFCPNCGHDTKAPGRETSRQRPSGITILAVLQGLGGLGALLLGVLMVIVAGLLGTIELPAEVPAYFTGVIAAVIGLVLIFIGIISFVVAYGFWNGLGWAWTLGIVVNVIGAIVDLASLPSGTVGLLLNALVLYYLTRPHVKRYFGKEPIQVTI
jgi:hypothetical protein